MTETEKKALAQAVAAAGRRMQDYNIMSEENVLRQSIDAHARAIAQHEAFRQEVSDAVGEFWSYCNTTDTPFPQALDRFIVAKPVDPDVQIVRDILHAHQRAMTPPDSGWGDMSYAKGSYDHLPTFKAALAAYKEKRGLQIVEVDKPKDQPPLSSFERKFL